MYPRQEGRLVARLTPALLAAAALVFAPAGVFAGEITSVNFFHIEVSSDLGSDEFAVLSENVPYDPGVPGGYVRAFGSSGSGCDRKRYR